jgi:hypothetical protein
METTAESRWNNVLAIWRDNRWLYLLSGVLIGVLIGPAVQQFTGNGEETLGNLVPEAIGIIFTVLILDRLVDNRNREALKQRLFSELRSSAVGQGTAALTWLRREGWVREDTLVGADLHRVNWENAFVGRLNLTGANLNGAILTNVSSQSTDASGERFEEPVTLQGASLRHADLRDAVLIEADLTDTDLWKADLSGAVLARANLRGASLGGARMTNVKTAGGCPARWLDLGPQTKTYSDLPIANTRSFGQRWK